MTPARWARMKEIFSAAQEKPRSERETFLNDVCADASLRQEVGRLLEAEDRPALKSPVAGMLAAPAPPATVGRYRIVRLLGEGGMGAVYEAEQDQPRRTVALKVIRSGLASRELLRRFEHEAQALGRLHHPGIAQIYEAGAADSGFGPQPYFAMEFIQGVSLLRYCKEHRLTTRQRLELMAGICDAVHHAHQRGIIHRDLKPGNILVEETGQPKIIDFGVSRVTGADARATMQTSSGQILGTLAYMSPEQVLADPLDLDTRSDVYALGVILYELLAGRLPYQIGDQLTRAVQAIREEDPAPLSSINRVFRGDVETIAAKALEKDKARRYASAAELAADIRRYLKDEPIVARRSTATYYLRKFARRHSALVTAMAAALVMLIGGAIVSTWEAARAWRAEQEALRQRDRAAAAQQAAQKDRDRAVGAERTSTDERNRAEGEKQRAEAEKQRAETEAATAKAINDFLRNDLLAQASVIAQAKAGGKPDPDLKVRTAVDRAAARIASRFDGQPLVEAAVRRTIGTTYRELGVYPEAKRQLERALDLQRRTLGDGHRDTLETMSSLAVLYRDQGKYAEAESLFTRVVAGWRGTLGEEARETAAAQRDQALLYQYETKYPQAEKIFAKVLETQRRVLGREHPETLTSMGSLANLYLVAGKYAAAAPLFIEVVDLDRRVLGEDHPETLASISSLAPLYFNQGKRALAERLLLDVVPRQRRVLGEEHPLTLESMDGLAQVYASEGKYAEAEPLSVKVLEIRRRTLGAEHPDTLESMNGLATLFYDEGKYAAAEPLASQALDAGRRVYGPENRSTLDAAYNLALVYQGEGKAAMAEALLTRVLELERRLLGEEHPFTLATVHQLGVVYQMEGKYAEAEAFSARAVDSSGRVRGEEHRSTLVSRTSLASLYQEEGKYAEAEPMLTTALELDLRILGPQHAATLSCLTSLARLRLAQHRDAEAESLLRETLNVPNNEGPYSWQPFERRSLLGQSLMNQSKFAEAEPLLISGYQGLLDRKSVLPVAVSVRQAGERIVQLHTIWGNPDRAAEWRKSLEAALPED